MGNEFEYKEEKKPEKENKDLINIDYFNYFNSSIKIENNIKFKFIKDNIFFSTQCDYDFTSKILEYIDKIKTLFYLYNQKIYCFKYPDLIRIPEYEEILNWYKNPIFISYQENTKRLFVNYNNYENCLKNEGIITCIYIFRDNKICMSRSIISHFDPIGNLIDISDDKLIILDSGVCKCLKYVNNEYKIIKIFKENFHSIHKYNEKDKFIAVTTKNIIIIDINNFQYISLFKHKFCCNICILDNKYLIGLEKTSKVIAIYNLNNFKLLGQLNTNIRENYIRIWDCGKSGYFIYNGQNHTADTFIAEFKNNIIKNVFFFSWKQIYPFSIFLYKDDFLVVGEFGKIIIYKKEIEIKKDVYKNYIK